MHPLSCSNECGVSAGIDFIQPEHRIQVVTRTIWFALSNPLEVVKMRKVCMDRTSAIAGVFFIAAIQTICIGKEFKHMKQELAKSYQPKEFEDRIYQMWEDHDCFKGVEDSKKKPFSIVMPPPNVTGQLHMGHALDCTLQDILTRFKRMQGYSTLWVPGTDHAGIATQIKVEEELRVKEGLTRYDLGREKFLQRVWKWK